MFLKQFFFRKKIDKTDKIINTERGYVLSGRVRGPKGSKFIEVHRTGKELKKFLPWLAKEVGISPLEALRQLSVEEAFRINNVLQ